MLDRSDKLRVTRRQFGLMAGVAGVALGAGGLPEIANAAGPDSAAIIKGKKGGLIIHNAKLGVMETPLTELRKHAITPKDILYNRFHFPHEGSASWYATTSPPPAEMVKNWKIRVDGLVRRPRDVTIAELEKMPQEKRVSVLQCAGNGRAYYAAKQKVGGGQWHHGGMGNVEWEGVPLKPLLAQLKMEPSPSAQWLTAEGWDQPATPTGTDFAKSYHLADDALDNAILALKMNGEPIPATNGGPVRLIVPGYYGNMNVKMLTMLLFAAEQNPSVYQSICLSDAELSCGARQVRRQRLHLAEQPANLWPCAHERDLLATAGRQAQVGHAHHHRRCLERRPRQDYPGRSVDRRWQELAQRGHQATGEPVGVAPLLRQGQARQGQEHGHVPGHRRAWPFPADRRSVALEPARLRVEWRRSRRDRHLTQGK